MAEYIVKTLPLCSGKWAERKVEVPLEGLGRACDNKYVVQMPRAGKAPEANVCGPRIVENGWSGVGLSRECTETNFGQGVVTENNLRVLENWPELAIEDKWPCPVIRLQELQKDPTAASLVKSLGEKFENYYQDALDEAMFTRFTE